MSRNLISVSWVSFNNDPYEREKDGSYRRDSAGQTTPGPTLEFLFGEGTPIAGRVKKHYLLVRRPTSPDKGLRSVDPLETDVARKLCHAIGQEQDPPEVETIFWDTDESPTNHRALYLFTAPTLAKIRRENLRAEIVVNLSPGTPAAQTVLLLTLQARIAGENVRAYQGTPRSKLRDSRDVVREVPWNLLAQIAATPSDIEVIRTRGERWSFQNARSPKLREVAKLVEQYKSVPFPVFIRGPRGIGKTSIAQQLRKGFCEWKNRPAKEQEMLPYHLNCAEFQANPELLRSELFGHEQGAFTGAKKPKAGILQSGEDDCVFLDEIHWMDPQAQGLLLLALQRNGRIRPIGSINSIPAKFRLIAATNQTPKVLREKLAPDFLDRISDLVIDLPELRDCREDLDEIWESVVFRACHELLVGDSVRVIDTAFEAEFRPHHRDIVRTLQSMRLPGNFRDLERLARRLLVGGLTSGRLLSLGKNQVHAELKRLREEEDTDGEQVYGSTISLIDELPTRARCEKYFRDVLAEGPQFSGEEAVKEWERRLLLAAYKVCGSGARAAALLGMNVRTFNFKLSTQKALSN